MPSHLSRMEFPSCFYAFLGVEEGCSCKAALTKAYRRRSVEMHPDKGGSGALFQRLSKILRILSDTELKNIYDAYGEAAVDQHLRNSETTLELEETPFVAEDSVPEGYQWRPLKDGEALPVGSTVKMDMSTGDNFVLELRTKEPDFCDDVVETPAPMGFCWSEDADGSRHLERLERVPDRSYRDFIEIRHILVTYDWEVENGARVAFTYKSGQDVFEGHFAHEAEREAAFHFEILEHNLFRSDWDGQTAKLFKRGGDYVLQMPHELWVAHTRKRAAADRLLGEKRPKQRRRSYTDAP